MLNNQPQGHYLLAVSKEVDFVSLGPDPLPDCMNTSQSLTLNWPPTNDTTAPLFSGPGLSPRTTPLWSGPCLVLDLNM